MRRRQINVSLEKAPKTTFEVTEPKMTLDEKLDVAERVATLGLMLYAGKVAVDAVGTIAVHIALKGIK